MKGIGRLPDVLYGLSARQRRAREGADAEFIGRHDSPKLATTEGMRVFARAVAHWNIQEYAGGEVDAVICARVDLDHPIYLPGNTFTDCADCGCRLQVRPDTPATGDRLCVCCGARRLRGSKL